VATPQLKEEIAFHRRMVSLLKREIFQVDRNSKSKYIREFVEEFRRFDELSSYDDLVIECFKADVIYVGDYHALPSSQSFTAHLLKEVASRSRRAILAVEMVYGRNQRVLDRWMAGEIDDDQFKRRIRYDLDWGYSWDGFKQVFEAARDYGLKVFGIDCPPRNGLRYIRKRDKYAARRIVDIFLKNPRAKIFVMIGESHLAGGHLPHEVRAELEKHNLEKRSVRVLQNLEDVYWQLVEQRQEHRDVVLLAPSTYCTFNASPIAKYEAYRQTINSWHTESAEEDDLDLTPTIHSMIDTILRFLSIDKYKKCLRRSGDCIEFLVDYYPEVYSRVDSSTLKALLTPDLFSRREIADIKRQIKRSGSCYIPRINSIFIGEFSLVHGGEEAAHFVNLALRGDEIEGRPAARSRPDAFYRAVMEEALGFFGSKLIDPSRNHFFETDLYEFHRKDRDFIEANTGYTYDQFNRIIGFILLHKKLETRYAEFGEIPPLIQEGVRTRDSRMFSILTHELGYYLGQQIYDGYHAGLIDRRLLKDLFHQRFDEEGSALKAYLSLVEMLPAVVPSE